VDSFQWNRLAGWVLAAAIAVLGISIVTGMIYQTKPVETKGYKIEGVEEVAATGAAEVEKPIAAFLASADPAKGEAQFKKCAACHNVEKGGANQIGPNLWGVVGAPVGKHPGYAYSDAVAGHGGQWTWDELSAWLQSPKKHIPGNKMSFAGISKPDDRANLLAWLNQKGDKPLPLPAAPAEEAPAAAAGEAAGDEAPADAAAAEAGATAVSPADEDKSEAATTTEAGAEAAATSTK